MSTTECEWNVEINKQQKNHLINIKKGFDQSHTKCRETRTSNSGNERIYSPLDYIYLLLHCVFQFAISDSCYLVIADSHQMFSSQKWIFHKKADLRETQSTFNFTVVLNCCDEINKCFLLLLIRFNLFLRWCSRVDDSSDLFVFLI